MTKHQTGYRKGYSSQHLLIAKFERWNGSLDKGRNCGGMFIDLSKAFDFLPYHLLLAKLGTYGFSYSSLRLSLSFLSNRKYRIKINSAYSNWEVLLLGVPQGSLLEG